ncbi:MULTISPECIES: S8 family serine peptidase [unclassified Streptomyces]|uniref:S8 family serine peptidase n=1 Tax=unclassified Streptomyces TaxID=2593676 RepID=UPI0029B63C52|nr:MULTISPECIES: S8 family serine peptidase [unclassified Streptomyces]MDX3771764.1 S8 family serine peptidase [Streptomyces sp. AK08-01B]MDX3820823.1 S8 family serine peptidase [Streptomyces sp. AK08-01A]
MFRARTRTPYPSVRTAAAIAAVLAAGGVSLASIPASADTASAQSATVDKLGDHDRALIAKYAKQYRARSVPVGAEQAVPDFVTLMLAVKAGRTEEAEQALIDLGVEVTRTDSEVGYIKANVPFADVDKVVALDDVLRVDADELLKLEDTRADSGSTDTAVQSAGHSGGLPAAPSAKTTDDNPYMPTNETSSVDFKQHNRNYDGRGVTIGIMDTGIDPTHPALATTTTGERKLVDTAVGTNPTNFIDLLFDRTWSLLTAGNKVTGPTVVKNNITWTLPAGDDLYLTTRLLSSTSYADPTLSGYLGTVYRPSDGAFFVDTDQDHVFSDDELIRPYKVDHEIGYIGTDNPATEVNERVPFTVEFKKFSSTLSGIDINTIDEAHGTHVAGITAANGMFGGAMNGQAPGAKLVSMRACTSSGCSSAALTDGMIDLATNHGVDVINMSIGSSPALNDGQSAMALLYNRLIDETGVQMFISAGNSGAGTNTVGDPTAGDKVVSVGASVSQATWWANYGSKVGFKDGIFPFSSRGPREDGGFKPDITAPGAAVAPTPAWIAPSFVAETGYTLPAGYSMMNGTSMASPQATGAAALLLSAAKQKGVSATPAELRKAIYTSADYNNKVAAIAQGHGQFDVEKAWHALSKGVATDEDITVSALVCTTLSGKLTTPDTGSGLFNSCAPDSGGQGVGESRTYDVTLTRTGGKDGAQPYELDLTGNDGTFSVPRRVTLEKDVPTVVQVTAEPDTQGTHSAVLTIDNVHARGLEQSALLAVEAGTPLTVGTTWSASGTVNRNETVHYTVAVPAGTKSLTVHLAGLTGESQIRWWAFTPEGVSGEKSSAGTIYCYANYLDGNGCNPTTRTYTNPKAGVWEFVVESRRTSPLLSNSFRLDANITQ